MTTTTIACAYSLTAVGATPVATLASRFAAIPVDLSVADLVGLLYTADTTATVGQTITRTITFRARPTSTATATAALFPGYPSGSPIASVTLTADGAGYAAPPIVRFSGGSPDNYATAIASMGLSGAAIIAGGSGYVSPTVEFVGGGLPTNVTPATATLTVGGGVITAVTITNTGALYQTPPRAVITATGGGSGAILSPALKVVGLNLLQGGLGYSATPTVLFNPFFAECCTDAQPNSQKAFLRNWMTATFSAVLRAQVVAADPVIS